jgi:hypothetical protein
MIYDNERKIMRCGQAVIKKSSKKYSREMSLSSI